MIWYCLKIMFDKRVLNMIFNTGQSLTLDSPCLPHGMLYLRTNISSDEMHEHDAKVSYMKQ